MTTFQSHAFFDLSDEEVEAQVRQLLDIPDSMPVPAEYIETLE